MTAVQVMSEDDTDSDGLLDDWELTHFGDLELYTASDDPDGDGFSNSLEYEAGTDPNNAKSNPAEIAKGDVDDSIITYAIIMSIIIIIVAVLIFGFILKTQRKKDVIGWDWMSQQDLDVGQATTLPGYEQQQQLPPGGVEPGAPGGEPGAAPVPMPAPAVTPELPVGVGAETEAETEAEVPEEPPSEEPAGEEAGGGFECPECGAAIAEADTSCPSCGVEFE